MYGFPEVLARHAYTDCMIQAQSICASLTHYKVDQTWGVRSFFPLELKALINCICGVWVAFVPALASCTILSRSIQFLWLSITYKAGPSLRALRHKRKISRIRNIELNGELLSSCGNTDRSNGGWPLLSCALIFGSHVKESNLTGLCSIDHIDLTSLVPLSLLLIWVDDVGKTKRVSRGSRIPLSNVRVSYKQTSSLDPTWRCFKSS